VLKHYHAIELKAEFEAEGSRLAEVQWLSKFASQVGLGLTIKIGGCEAVSDLREAVIMGATTIVAPMIETPYALSKYQAMVARCVTDNDRERIKFFWNLETATAFENLPTMIKQTTLDGFVIGRVDLCGSLELGRKSVDCNHVLDLTTKASELAKAHNLLVVVGGGVTVQSKKFFEQLPKLDRFETRKVVFKCPEALAHNADLYDAATEFELIWLNFKRSLYTRWANEDNARIGMLEKRLAASN
jgi:hypothetical protein